MRSIFLDYYIGSLLLWSGKEENFEALSCEPIYGSNERTHPECIVLDGQQRLTAMHYAFFAPDKPHPRRANRYYYFIRVDRFMAEEYDAAFDYDWSKRWAQLLVTPEQQYANHLFPLAVVGAGIWRLADWVRGYEDHWRKASLAGSQSDGELHAKNAVNFGEHLRTLTGQYQVSYIELNQDLGIDKVCDIFTQVNSKGVQLDTFDLMNAMLKPKGLQLKHMWRDAAPMLAFVDSRKMNVYILQVMSILAQAYCSPKYLYFLLPGAKKPVRDPDGTRREEVLVPDTSDFRRRWNRAVTSIQGGINVLRHPQEFGAVSSKYLPYVSILPVFTAIQAHVKSLPANRWLKAKEKIRRWYWASVFLNRYSGAVESTAARDFLDLKAWMDDDARKPSLIDEFKIRFRQLDLEREVRRGTSIYNGVFNLLVLHGARDWVSDDVPQHGDLNDHHIIPASKWKEIDAQESINSILNRTPLTAETNQKVVRDRWPYEYLPELIAENGAERVRSVLESHFISREAFDILLRNPFTAEDFVAFTRERQRTLLDAIERFFVEPSSSAA